MKRLIIVGAILAVLSLASGCKTLEPFTHTLREKHNISEVELQSLHYYLSRPLILEQRFKASDIDITKNRGLRVAKGLVIDQVVIQTNTPGIVEAVEPDALLVSFEEGTVLKFGTAENLAVERQKYYRIRYTETEDGRRQVQFGADPYMISQGSTSAVLMIDMKELRMLQRNRHIAPGRTLD